MYSKLLRHAATLLLGAVLVASTSPYAVRAVESPDLLKNVIDEKARQLDEVTKQLQQAQIKLTDEVVQGKTLKAEVAQIDSTVKKVNLNIKVSEITLEKLNLEIRALQAEIAAKEEVAAKKRETVGQLLQSFQQRGRESALLSFLNGQSIAEGVIEAQNISDLNDALLHEVDELRQLKQELADQLAATGNKKSAVENERETLKVRKSIAQDQLAERQRLLAETKNREENYKKIVSELERQQQEISDQIGDIEEALRTQYGTSSVPMKRPGVFAKPVESGVLTQAFGKTKDACRLYRKTCLHNGIDYGIPVGTRVLAADDGVVLMAGNNGRVQYGRYILIKHANGLTTLYAHLSRQSVKTGDTVTRRSVIGYSGKTGYAFGAHLHFGVYLSSTVQLKSVGGAGVVPVGYVLDPHDYL